MGYWQEREKNHIKENIANDEQLKYQITIRYHYMLRKIEEEIHDFYARYANSEGISIGEAKKRADAMDVEAFAKQAKEYVKNKDFSEKANKELKLYNLKMKINRLELLKAKINLELAEFFQDLDNWYKSELGKEYIAEYDRQSGILGESIKHKQKRAEQAVKGSYKNATYSERIWLYQEKLRTDLQRLLLQGLIKGMSLKLLARELRKIFDVSRYDAERLLVTEMARVQTEAQKDAYREYGYDEYEFIAESEACPYCREINGKIFKTEKMDIGENAAPMHPWCRCSTAAYKEREDDDNSLDNEKTVLSNDGIKG